MKRGILVIGSLNMDMSVDMAKMPVVGETVLGEAVSYKTGGKGANQACAAGKLGGEVRMLGCIGQDEFGRRLVESLQGSGVETKYLKESGSQPTGLAVICVDHEGNNSIVVIPGANKECNVEYLKARDEQFQWCDYVVLQMEIPHDAVWYGVKRAKELGKTVILNPAPAPEAIPEDIFSLIDYITPNETELAALSQMGGEDQEAVRQAAGFFIQRGIPNVVVTLGDKGAMAVGADKERFYPARRAEAVDTTAAGDCFNGALAAALAEGQEKDQAIRFANLASSIAVTRKGAQESLPNREELEAIL